MQPHPVIYEINTWPWLERIGRRLGHPVTLGTVPEDVWDSIAVGPVDAVWLMGVWQRSPAGVQIALADGPLVDTFRAALPDYTSDDVVGSPYCIRDYVVDEHLGGCDGLATARAALAARGIGLILDYVPNHLATDHPWVTTHPERFVAGTTEDLDARPAEFVGAHGRVLANGRDPHFPPWRDVLQLNAFHPETVDATIDELRGIAERCDGVRCDMAMLMTTDIFTRTWGDRVGPAPAQDYWTRVIPAVREQHPGFLFVAESYWGTEQLLRSQGFDHCYDKAFTDALEHHPHEVARLIHHDPDPAGKVRFLENHDEPRAQSVFGHRHRTAALTALTQPGARLVHDGQADGRTTRLPVQLRREPVEPVDPDLRDFYRTLLRALNESPMRTGDFDPLHIHGWPDRPTGGLVAWAWTDACDASDGGGRHLIVVNLDDAAAAGRVQTPWPALTGSTATLTDLLTGIDHYRPADPDEYVFVMLPGWGAHLLDVHIHP
ncbi:putative alpha amylase [Gordonia polyisoprenivorans VH2]|uniref:Putative alpha amylase n=1 Tax=Gordonia polyisoprenivorans (strain DSM 44266 / VH2) TaxID=1112204 RepID=H6N371_GORPV|nr:alpha-amylase family glycosyl hydrolase [Gordonia polyisoprenivorans]AFA71110.1 putative alpha amylase [Gordonia polyisoprenivorans VH2]